MLYLIGFQEYGHSLNVTDYDLLLSAIHLNTPYKELKTFLQLISVYNKCQLPRVIRELEIVSAKESFTFYKNGYFMLDYKEPLDWSIINLLYSMNASLDPQSVIRPILNFNEAQRLNMFELHNDTKYLTDKYLMNNNYTMFNYRRYTNLLRKHKIKYKIIKDKIILTFNNVKIGNDAEGYIIYNKIHIAIKDGRIDGYVFQFKDFDYSSYWKLPIILHPHLSHISGSTQVITSDTSVKLLKKTIKEYNPSIAYKPIKEIVIDFMRYRKLWNTLRFVTKDNLSRKIFESFNKQSEDSLR